MHEFIAPYVTQILQASRRVTVAVVRAGLEVINAPSARRRYQRATTLLTERKPSCLPACTVVAQKEHVLWCQGSGNITKQEGMLCDGSTHEPRGPVTPSLRA